MGDSQELADTLVWHTILSVLVFWPWLFSCLWLHLSILANAPRNKAPLFLPTRTLDAYTTPGGSFHLVCPQLRERIRTIVWATIEYIMQAMHYYTCQYIMFNIDFLSMTNYQIHEAHLFNSHLLPVSATKCCSHKNKHTHLWPRLAWLTVIQGWADFTSIQWPHSPTHWVTFPLLSLTSLGSSLLLHFDHFCLIILLTSAYPLKERLSHQN